MRTNMVREIVICVILAVLQSVTSSILNVDVTQVDKIFHGRYTRDVSGAELLIPRHVHRDGKFKTFMLPNFYSRHEINERRKRSSSSYTNDNEDKLHLILPFNGKEHHVELSPFHDFISPELVIETRGEGIGTNISKGLRFKRLTDEQCYYRGTVRGHSGSRAALSLCDGVAGYVLIDDGRFYIEPLDDSEPGSQGQHVHMIYKRHATHEDEESKGVCDTGDDWESAWTKQLIKREHLTIEASNSNKFKPMKSSNVSTSTHSLHRYIEICLVVDKKFMEFWSGGDSERYLLTVMNMVSDFYHDSSIGNLIDVVIVRMIYLEAEKEEFDLTISPRSEETLDSFSRWANRINPSDATHPNHFDIAVLVTRHDICSEKSGCVLMGLAYLATACNPEQAVALCEDSGLVLGIVITHEIGHVMGSSHDEVHVNGCSPKDRDSSYFIMSPIVFIYTLRWSKCSRRFISNLLNSKLGDCLLDDPKESVEKYKYPNMLPGAMYDSNAQCALMQPNSVMCELGGYSTCRGLWCQQGKNCFSTNAPPAEGTQCGENKWCMRQQCVTMGVRPAAIHGGWSEWGPTSKCSRTCGAGVSIAKRECNNPLPSNGGRYCIGERRRITICNINPCDPNKPSFRAKQCSEHNTKQILSDGFHKWKPFLRQDLDPCSLYCIGEHRTFVKMGLAKDTTPCKSGTRDMCISGVCREVGCDWKFDSKAVKDQCGVCGGDGTECDAVEGKYTDTKPFGYAKIVIIPEGSTGVRVVEMEPTDNILAVKYAKSDEYCLNGGLKQSHVGEYECAGSRLIYGEPQYRQEEIEIKGPITENIEIQLLFMRKRNRGIFYRYSLPKTSSSEYVPRYLWEFIKWSQCNANCGGGTSISMPTCIEEEHGIVSVSFCDDTPRPDPKTRLCNEQPCRYSWRASQWSECSACIGHISQQTRRVICVKRAARLNGDDIETDSRNCRGEPPVQKKKCKGTKLCKPRCHPKPKTSLKKQSISSSVKKISMRNSNNIDNANITNRVRNSHSADDKDIEDKNESDDKNENTKQKLTKILHNWASKNKDKRMCGDEKYLLEIETEVTDAVPKAFATDKESRPILSDAEPEGVTSEVGLNLITIDDELTTTSITESNQEENMHEGDTEMKSLSTLEPGTLIKDEYPPDKAVLLEAPIKDDSFKANLSDIAFQEIGDSVPIQIDTSREKIYTGPEARERINEMAYGNITDMTESPDSDTADDNSTDF